VNPNVPCLVEGYDEQKSSNPIILSKATGASLLDVTRIWADRVIGDDLAGDPIL